MGETMADNSLSKLDATKFAGQRPKPRPGLPTAPVASQHARPHGRPATHLLERLRDACKDHRARVDLSSSGQTNSNIQL